MSNWTSLMLETIMVAAYSSNCNPKNRLAEATISIIIEKIVLIEMIGKDCKYFIILPCFRSIFFTTDRLNR